MGEPETYRGIIEEFCGVYDIDRLPVPELRVDMQRADIVADPDDYAIVIGGRHVTRLGLEENRDAVMGALTDLHESVLADRVEAHTAALEEFYAPFGAEVAVEEQVFTDLNEEDEEDDDRYTNGKYSAKWETVKIDDTKFMKHVDPERQTTNSRKLERVIRHECAHGLHYGTNPLVGSLSDHVSATSDDYTGDVRRAAIEAITRFEQYRTGYGQSDRDEEYERLRDPWSVPDVFDDHTDYDEHGLALFDSPYKLGHFAAHAVDAAFTERYSEDEGRERTREFLLYCVTTPTGLAGSIEESFYQRGLPYYPRLVTKWENRLDDQNVAQYVQAAGASIRRQAATADGTEERCRYHYEARALHRAAIDHLDEEELDPCIPQVTPST
jgi:hypothetical protein